jgi:hypothetical protein
MSTRSAIAIPKGEDGWQGRYCHFDGYPSGVGMRLLSIVDENGLIAAIKVLTEEHTSWSIISDAQPTHDATGWVDGYGQPYDDDDPEGSWIQDDGDHWGTEWCYMLTMVGLRVLHRHPGVWVDYGTFSWGDPLAALEVGALECQCPE